MVKHTFWRDFLLRKKIFDFFGRFQSGRLNHPRTRSETSIKKSTTSEEVIGFLGKKNIKRKTLFYPVFKENLIFTREDYIFPPRSFRQKLPTKILRLP